MAYITMDVEIHNGLLTASEPEKLPENGKGILTVVQTDPSAAEIENMTRLEAFKALQKSLNLDDAKAQAWMDLIRDARR